MDDNTETNVKPSNILKQRVVIELMYAFCGAVVAVVSFAGKRFDLLLFAIGAGVSAVCSVAACLTFFELKKTAPNKNAVIKEE